MNAEQIKHMVSRFLAWKLPQSFNPDGGVHFDREANGAPRPEAWWPTGTNLLDASQAEEMVRHMLEGLPTSRVCWMIELAGVNLPLYWYRPLGPDGLAGWTSIAGQGMQFATKDEAHREVSGTIGYPQAFHIREHRFL